jgi:hypothetical protein
MIRLAVLTEGLTELDFVNTILAPHLLARSDSRIFVSAPTLRGHATYSVLRKFVKTLLHSISPELRVSTMIDLFKLAGDFPGKAEAGGIDPMTKVNILEQRFAADIDDARFIPYVQLHEFEALILVDPSVLGQQHPNRRTELGRLHNQINRDFPTPEHVNGMDPPSYRIRRAVPEYDKRLDGVATIERIGLERLRARCAHFGAWMGKIEDLSAQ